MKKCNNETPYPMPPLLQGGNTIRQLLKIAKKAIPKVEWRQTPVVLKATAGLRLLAENEARALLKEVRNVSAALRQIQTPPVSPKERAEKPLRNHCLVSLKKKPSNMSTRLVAMMLRKNSCCGIVWSNRTCH